MTVDREENPERANDQSDYRIRCHSLLSGAAIEERGDVVSLKFCQVSFRERLASAIQENEEQSFKGGEN